MRGAIWVPTCLQPKRERRESKKWLRPTSWDDPLHTISSYYPQITSSLALTLSLLLPLPFVSRYFFMRAKKTSTTTTTTTQPPPPPPALPLPPPPSPSPPSLQSVTHSRTSQSQIGGRKGRSHNRTEGGHNGVIFWVDPRFEKKKKVDIMNAGEKKSLYLERKKDPIWIFESATCLSFSSFNRCKTLLPPSPLPPLRFTPLLEQQRLNVIALKG